jgi:hypothetical protein
MPAGSAPTASTNVSTSMARASQLNSPAAKEIHITINNTILKSSLQALEKPNTHILLKANKAITRALGAFYCTSHNYNNGTQTTALTPATTQWIDSVKLINSKDIFLYMHTASSVEKLIHSSKK